MDEQSASSNDMNGWGALRTRGYRHNQEQKLFLVSFMEAHPEFAFGRYAGPRQKAQALWVQLTDEMNARGPKKTVAQWQKAWTDVKSRARVRVHTKANNPNYDPANDVDARVVALLDSVSGNSIGTYTSNLSDYESGDPSINETSTEVRPSDFLNVEADVLPPEMVLFSETDARPESVESCSISDIKLVLAPDKDLDAENLEDDDLDLEDQASNYDTEDLAQNVDQNSEYGDNIDTGQLYDEPRASDSRQNRQRISSRNRLRTLPNRTYANRPNVSSSSSNFYRRQTETLEAISKALLQNAQNEKERIRLMSQSLEVEKARLKADIERNNLLRNLVSSVKSLSQDKNLCLR